MSCPSTCTGTHGDNAVRCALPAGHDGRHSTPDGLLTWWDPPKVFIGGNPYEPNDAEVRFSWEEPSP